MNTSRCPQSDLSATVFLQHQVSLEYTGTKTHKTTSRYIEKSGQGGCSGAAPACLQCSPSGGVQAPNPVLFESYFPALLLSSTPHPSVFFGIPTSWWPRFRHWSDLWARQGHERLNQGLDVYLRVTALEDGTRIPDRMGSSLQRWGTSSNMEVIAGLPE